ncbi:site-specific DNA-methyltransferase [Opitutaceae bacterium TAV4]|nr:site-specific DNA-methyltransferase [Opitutaceae bacterium TAV4]RRK02366.1 site-specific DNA-methyltransferase [Opitutaceae bacterium TAV3]
MSTQATLHFGDCIEGMATKLAPDSIDLCVTSIPFGALFMYSGKREDIGNNRDCLMVERHADMLADQFGLHMRFWVAQLLRVMRPGRNICIHIQQLLKYANQHGAMGRRDLRNATVRMMELGGFEWKAEFAIPKNPQAMAQRNNLHCLMFATGKRDAVDLGPAPNDFVLVFQKPGENAVPVPALRDENANPRGWVATEEWIKWASGVWGDIRETDVLDGWKSARETDEERHVCPLQLEVIRRCVKLYTNPGELVLDPFMGIGSTAYVSVEQGRRAVGFELKESYHNLSIRNLEKQAHDMREASVDLFTMAGAGGAA